MGSTKELIYEYVCSHPNATTRKIADDLDVHTAVVHRACRGYAKYRMIEGEIIAGEARWRAIP